MHTRININDFRLSAREPCVLADCTLTHATVNLFIFLPTVFARREINTLLFTNKRETGFLFAAISRHQVVGESLVSPAERESSSAAGESTESNLGMFCRFGGVQAPTESANEQSSVPPPVAAVKDRCTAALWKSRITLCWPVLGNSILISAGVYTAHYIFHIVLIRI